jgi:hypothetical protein
MRKFVNYGQKSFITLAPYYGTTHYALVYDKALWQNKLECLPIATFFQASLILVSCAEAYS